MNNLNKSHIKVYEFFVGAVKTSGNPKVVIKCKDLSKITGYSYPIVVKCLHDLLHIGFLKLLRNGRGRKSIGAIYLVDDSFKLVKRSVQKIKVYKAKYTVSIIELRRSKNAL